jgi:hypothetical protein
MIAKARAYYDCLNLFANTNGKKDEEKERKKKLLGRGEKRSLGPRDSLLLFPPH